MKGIKKMMTFLLACIMVGSLSACDLSQFLPTATGSVNSSTESVENNDEKYKIETLADWELAKAEALETLNGEGATVIENGQKSIIEGYAQKKISLFDNNQYVYIIGQENETIWVTYDSGTEGYVGSSLGMEWNEFWEMTVVGNLITPLMNEASFSDFTYDTEKKAYIREKINSTERGESEDGVVEEFIYSTTWEYNFLDGKLLSVVMTESVKETHNNERSDTRVNVLTIGGMNGKITIPEYTLITDGDTSENN